jgi:carboxyl-terminal processing protease
MGSKKLQIWLPLLFAIVMTLGMFVGYKLRADTSTQTAGFMQNTRSNTVQEILNLIQNKYVDNISIDSIKEDAINAMLSHLDPHSI